MNGTKGIIEMSNQNELQRTEEKKKEKKKSIKIYCIEILLTFLILNKCLDDFSALLFNDVH
jgi:hypothetical protein